MIDKLKRSEVPLERVTYGGVAVKLGPLEAAYLDLLWMNRGYLIDNEWISRVLWPRVDRLELLASNRLAMLASSVRKKLPGVVETVWGVGRYIPAGSGLLIQRMNNGRPHLFIKAPLPDTPREKPRTFNG